MKWNAAANVSKLVQARKQTSSQNQSEGQNKEIEKAAISKSLKTRGKAWIGEEVLFYSPLAMPFHPTFLAKNLLHNIKSLAV